MYVCTHYEYVLHEYYKFAAILKSLWENWFIFFQNINQFRYVYQDKVCSILSATLVRKIKS